MPKICKLRKCSIWGPIWAISYRKKDLHLCFFFKNTKLFISIHCCIIKIIIYRTWYQCRVAHFRIGPYNQTRIYIDHNWWCYSISSCRMLANAGFMVIGYRLKLRLAGYYGDIHISGNIFSAGLALCSEKDVTDKTYIYMYRALYCVIKLSDEKIYTSQPNSTG